ncbi:DinB family protein [Flaviaesturariibacter amylovorans]|uniref:DinB-like domain-containing protein n=1 Tax=Flaviaesturariibacter amylovorans TaxID=1084520 RepID=A0ABP8G5D6_9BACT
MIDTLKTLFARDLGRLRSEIAAYTQEANLWKVEGVVTNSAGNLCLHLLGNLNTYIGRELGGTGYVRDRALEFAAREVPRADLLNRIDATRQVVTNTLDGLDEAALEREYPELVFDKKTSAGFLLVHLATHLAYHLGQVNYHRRLIDR